MMEEDVTGTMREIGHDTAVCSLCGQPYPADAVSPLEVSPEAGVLSERADVCPRCQDALARGEDPATLSAQWPQDMP